MLNLVQRLAEAHVEFIIVGGMAAAAHGAVRVTFDLDVCFRFERTNLERLLTALHDLNPQFRPPPSGRRLPMDVEQLLPYKNLYLQTDLGDLDCLSELAGIGNYQAVEQRSQLIRLRGYEVRLLDLSALIEGKKALNRPKDAEALLELEEILRKNSRNEFP